MNQQSTSVVTGTVVDPLATAPFKGDEKGNFSRNVADRTINSSINVSLTVDDMANIGVVRSERAIRERLDANAKAQAEARRTRDAALAAMDKILTETAKTSYPTHNEELKNSLNTAAWTFKHSNSFQFIEGRSGATDSIRVDASLEAKYRGPIESMTGDALSLRASFTHPVPDAYYAEKGIATGASRTLQDLEAEGLRIRLDLSNLGSLAREAKAAITESVLRGDDTVKMIEDIKKAEPMKALPPTA